MDILENFLAEREDGGKPSDAECKSFLVDMTHNREYETLIDQQNGGAHPRIPEVQDGCNQFCTYCIIPSRAAESEAAARVMCRRSKRLVEAGYQEVVLTGIHLPPTDSISQRAKKRDAARPHPCC